VINAPCGNVENFLEGKDSHRSSKISTEIFTALVENNSFDVNSKLTFPHFHRPYYYYYI